MKKYPGPFKVKLPEIYQIEASAACDHDCVMCPRGYYHRENKQPFFDLDLLQCMISRGDLKGSYFVELQMSGEPLLNPDIAIMINLLKNEGMIVGLSTHGDLFPDLLEACQRLDYITISVDSITKRENIRKGSKFGNPIEYLENLRNSLFFFINKGVPVDLQFIELPGWEEERNLLYNFLIKEFDSPHLKTVNIRSIPDCCITHRTSTRLKKEEDKGICLNPWLSVSVQSNGNVVPCCFAWGDDLIYGNLYDSSLEEIWNSPNVEQLRRNHSGGYIHLPDLCMKCYMRSPALLHWEIYLDSIRKKKV